MSTALALSPSARKAAVSMVRGPPPTATLPLNSGLHKSTQSPGAIIRTDSHTSYFNFIFARVEKRLRLDLRFMLKKTRLFLFLYYRWCTF